MLSIRDYDFTGKKALIRVDFNVPLDENFNVTDDTRIRAAAPTIKLVLEKGGAAILMSHMGRPKGERLEKFSLKHIVPKVSEILGTEVKFAPDCIGQEVEAMVKDLKPGEVLLLENLRFHKEETKGDEEFARQLASLADVYINDAFGTAHRAHASTAIVAKFVKDKMFGLLMEKEIESLNRVLKDTKRPFTAIIAGSKVSTKITVIESLIEKVDNLIIGGAMTYTFVKARGGQTGNSLVEEDMLEIARDIEKKAKEKGVNLYLPVDSVNAKEFKDTPEKQITPIDQVPEGWMGLDIGPKSVELFAEVIKNSATILWNGPVGVFEFENFLDGTRGVGEAVAEATDKGSFSLIGGGDTVAAVNKLGLAPRMSYISTGGGALLEYIEGKQLPGIKAILEG